MRQRSIAGSDLGPTAGNHGPDGLDGCGNRSAKGVGSAVPVQSNSRWNRLRSPRGRLRRGWSRGDGSGRASHRGRGGTPRPSARTATCGSCRCRTARRSSPDRDRAFPARGRRRRSTVTPRSSSSATEFAIGKTRPVGLVTWSMIATRVRGDRPFDDRLDHLVRGSRGGRQPRPRPGGLRSFGPPLRRRCGRRCSRGR